MQTPLNIVIESENRLKAETLKVLKKLLPELEKIKGQKILNVGGNLSKKTMDIISPLLNKDKFHRISVRASYSSLILNVCICVNGGSYEDNTYYCQYFENTIFIGTINEQSLKEIYSLDSSHLNFYTKNKKINLTSIMKKVEQFKVAQEKARKLLSEIPEVIIDRENLRM